MMSALILKCETLLTTTKALSASLSELSAKLRTNTYPIEQPRPRQTSEQRPVNELLLNVLEDLENLGGQSEALQSQVEDIKTQVQGNQEQNLDDSPRSVGRLPTPGEQLPNSGASQPDGSALSRCQEVAHDEQPGTEEGLMIEPAGNTSSDEHKAQEDISNDNRGRAKGDTQAIYAVASQRAVGPSISVTNHSPGLPTASRSGTPASPSSTHTSHDMSPAASVSTQITWPDNTARGNSQDALISRNEYGERSGCCSENTPIQTDVPENDDLRHEADTTVQADDSSHDTHPDPTICGASNETIMDTPSPENSDANDSGPGFRPTTQDKVHLSPTDMERLVPRLAELECQGAGQHVSVPPIDISLADLQGSIDMGDENWQYKSIRYEASQKDKGFSRVYVSHNTSSIDWPGFTAKVEKPTISEARAIFEKVARDPPTGEIPYYVGHTNGFAQSALDPGPVIMNNPAFKDLQTPYHHIGGDLSAHCCHCEDMTSVEKTSEGPVYHGLRSYNEVYFGTGYKLWLVIAKHHVAKFDKFARSKWNYNGCNQGLRHECLLLAPSLLEEKGIEYIIAVVGCGEAFWTTPGQQHQVINFGYCAARSINFSHPEDELDLGKAIQCSDCGMFEAGKEFGAPIVPPPVQESRRAPSTRTSAKRKLYHEAPRARSKKTTRTYTAAQRELEEIRCQLEGVHYHPPSLDPKSLTSPEVEVYKYVAAVQSEPAIRQFVQLVHQWREQELKQTFAVASSALSLEQAVAQVIQCEGRTKLHKFCLRLAQIRLAQKVNETKRPIQKRLETESLDKLASDSRISKDDVKRHLRDGNRWIRLCGPYSGLLAFILLDPSNVFGIKKEDWTQLSKERDATLTGAFHALLDNGYTKKLCIAGEALEKLVSGSPLTFLWEGGNLNPADINVHIRLAQYKDTPA